MMNNYISTLMRELIAVEKEEIRVEVSTRREIRIGIFMCFVLLILALFFFFWVPFLNGLNNEIYKTKLMLLIIPLEILVKNKSVGKVLQSQNIIGANGAKKKQ